MRRLKACPWARSVLLRREMALTDRLVIAHTAQRAVALVADSVSGVIEHAGPDRVDAEAILPGLEYVDGVVKLDDGLILINDLRIPSRSK